MICVTRSDGNSNISVTQKEKIGSVTRRMSSVTRSDGKYKSSATKSQKKRALKRAMKSSQKRVLCK